MRRTLRATVALAAFLPVSMVLGGCQSNAQTGSLIGAGAGALGGYVVGNEMDKSDADDDRDDRYDRRPGHKH